MGGISKAFGGLGDMLSSAHNNIFKPVNNAVNDVMKVVDPVGGYLKEKSENAVDKAVNSLLAPSSDLGGSPATPLAKAVSDEQVAADSKKKKIESSPGKRQGAGAGATLLVTDDESQLQKNTLLGM